MNKNFLMKYQLMLVVFVWIVVILSFLFFIGIFDEERDDYASLGSEVITSHVKKVSQQRNEIVELCEESSLCFLSENSEYTELMAILAAKSKDTRFNFVLIANSIPEPEPESKPKPEDTASASSGNSDVASQVGHSIPVVRVQPLNPTLDNYCRQADLCLLGRDFSLDQLLDGVKSIGHGNKSIKFMILEN